MRSIGSGDSKRAYHVRLGAVARSVSIYVCGREPSSPDATGLPQQEVLQDELAFHPRKRRAARPTR